MTDKEPERVTMVLNEGEISHYIPKSLTSSQLEDLIGMLSRYLQDKGLIGRDYHKTLARGKEYMGFLDFVRRWERLSPTVYLEKQNLLGVPNQCKVDTSSVGFLISKLYKQYESSGAKLPAEIISARAILLDLNRTSDAQAQATLARNLLDVYLAGFEDDRNGVSLKSTTGVEVVMPRGYSRRDALRLFQRAGLTPEKG